MDAMTLLQWQNLIFLLPCGIAALLLLLSSLRLGHHAGHGLRLHGHAPAAMAHPQAGVHSTPGAVHGHGAAHSGPLRHSATPSTPARSAHAAHGTTRGAARQEGERPQVSVTTNFILHLTGADRAPLLMIVEAFCLVWGLGGYLANLALLHATNPTPRQILPSLLVALCAGLIGARMGAELLGRVMPKEESLDVSQDGLFGLTGRIAFPVSATAGRIHIYDGHGTLHDETCRVAANMPGIAKGRRAMVVDVDRQGMLLVEEVPDIVQ